jgi:glycosyltransferase involved in cell wall biosynthesis
VNEALASARPVLVSDRVGCAADVVDQSCGDIFDWRDPPALRRALDRMTRDRDRLIRMRQAAAERRRLFDVSVTETMLLSALAVQWQR